MLFSNYRIYIYQFCIITLFFAVYILSGERNVHAQSLSDSYETTVGVTYYGGNYDQTKNSWIIDNQNQCARIASGEISAVSLDAIVSDKCKDDNGLQNLANLPLHNTVSFAELSKEPEKNDYSALGNLPRESKLLIRYKDRCIIAEKLDVGSGGTDVLGNKRSLDLWWQTARTLDFKNGFDLMSVKLMPIETPVTKLGETTPCPGLPEGLNPNIISQVAPTDDSPSNEQNKSTVYSKYRNLILAVIGVSIFAVLVKLSKVIHQKIIKPRL